MNQKKGNRFIWSMHGALLVSIILGCFALPFSSFIADDFIFLGKLEKVSPLPSTGPLSLYTLADGNPQQLQRIKETGAFPWYIHSSFKMKFFRPLSSGLFALDHALFGLKPLGYSIHNLVWYIILISGVALLFKKLIPEEIERWALFIYGISGIFAVSVFWSSSRHNLIAPGFAVWAFFIFITWQETHRIRFLVVSLVLFILAFLAGESALGMIAYPIAYVWFTSQESWKRKLLSEMPLLILVAIYLAFYAYLGYGAYDGSDYISPFHRSGQFFINLPVRLLAIAGGLFLGGATDIFAAAPEGQNIFVITGAFSLLLFFWLIYSLQHYFSITEKRTIIWISTAIVLSSLPFASASIFSFRLVVPFIGMAVIIAHILYHWRMDVWNKSGFKFRLMTIACMLLFFLHLILAPVMRIASPVILKKLMATRLATAMKAMDNDVKDIKQKRIIIFNAPDLVIGFHSYFYRELFRMPMPVSWQVLSSVRDEHTITRVNDRTFTVQFMNKHLEKTAFHPHDSISLPGLQVTVLETDDKGVRSFECRADRSLDDPSLVFLTWQSRHLQPISMPAINKSILLPFRATGL